MPQFDFFSYCVQFFWMFVAFITLFLLLNKNVLTKIIATIKLRSKISAYKNELKKVASSADKMKKQRILLNKILVSYFNSLDIVGISKTSTKIQSGK